MLQSKIRSMFRQNRLSDWLPYATYDEESSLYLNSDSTMGFVLEFSPVMFAGEQLISGLTSLLQQEWPKDSLIQFILYADPNMTGIIDRYTRLRDTVLDVSNPRDEFNHNWVHWQASYLRSHRHHGISRDVPVPFRNFRCFITVKIPATRADFTGRSTKSKDQLLILRDSVQGTLRSNAISSLNCPPEGLIKLLWQAWNPRHEFLEENIWDWYQPLKYQIIAPDTQIEKDRWNINVDGIKVSVRLPQVYAQEIMSFNSNQLIGDLMGSNLQQICAPFFLTLNIDPTPVDKELNVKQEVVALQKSAFKALSPKTERKRSEFAWVAEQREKGERFIRGYLTLVMYNNETSSDENGLTDMTRHESSVTTLWGNQGFRLQKELFCSLEYMMAALPFGLYRDAVKNMNRFVTSTARAFATLAPIQADWRGTQRESMLFLTRRGQLCALDIFDSDTNFNFAVAAPSGSGKSFLVNKILQEYASQKGECYIIDVGKSYKKQTTLQLGQYIEFDDDSDLSANIFGELGLETFMVDKQELEKEFSANPDEHSARKRERASLLTLYSQLLGVMANPTQPITDLEQATLSAAMIEAYAGLQPEQVMEIDGFVEVLDRWQKQNDDMHKQDFTAGQLATRLRKYCRAGEHGRWFRGKMNIDFNRPFVVLELESLNAAKDLREVVLLLLISLLERKFYHGDRRVPKIMLLDEAWDLFGNPNTANFIESMYRRIRKYGGAVGTIVQSFLDYANKGNESVGQAILSNSEWKLCLQPKVEELRECQKRNLIAIPEAGLQMAQTVRTTKGLYSEVLLLSSNQCSVFRFIPTPAEKVAFTTVAKEVQVYENIERTLLKSGTKPDPLMLISLSGHANMLMEKGYSPEQAERMTMENTEAAMEYGMNLFHSA